MVEPAKPQDGKLSGPVARARGLRPVQVWVQELRDPAVRDQLRADAALVRGHPSTAEGDAFVNAAMADLAGWRG